MTYTEVSLKQTLGALSPFSQLPAAALEKLASSSQRLRYRIGQPMLRQESMPHQLIVIEEGKGRLLGYDPYQKTPMTLTLLEAGAVLGLASLVRGVPCESAIASSEVVAVVVPIYAVQQLMGEHERFAQSVASRCYLAEVFDLVSQYYKAQARSVSDLADTARELQAQAIATTLGSGQVRLSDRDPHRLWFVSSDSIPTQPVGSWLLPEMFDGRINCQANTRLIGIDMRRLVAQ
ncbi:MAG: cyclic nucleotide-binding domain-containing protein, partial [Phormidesmis sp.]